MKDFLNSFFKNILIIVAIIATIIFGGFVYFFDTSSCEELIDNYESKTKEINDVKTYVNSILSDSVIVNIEFANDKELSIFHVKTGKEESIRNWNIQINSTRVDSILKTIHWNKTHLQKIKEKLDAANCISVSSGEPFNIGYSRHVIGTYFYNIFSNPINDSLIKNYNDSCSYIYYKPTVVLQWGGGAIGGQCFPDFKQIR
jgi:hypothetical protein